MKCFCCPPPYLNAQFPSLPFLLQLWSYQNASGSPRTSLPPLGAARAMWASYTWATRDFARPSAALLDTPASPPTKAHASAWRTTTGATRTTLAMNLRPCCASTTPHSPTRGAGPSTEQRTGARTRSDLRGAHTLRQCTSHAWFIHLVISFDD